MGEAILESEVRTLKLAQSFPCLTRLASIKQGLWNPNELDAWATKASLGERQGAAFLLTVWNQHEDWQCGKFNVFDAAVVWDEAHRAAFFAWMKEPWFA